MTKRKRTRPAITIAWGRVMAAPCPVCRRILRSASGFASPGNGGPPRSGDRTLCDQCLTWLVFDGNPFRPGLRLRRATPQEITTIDPDARRMVEDLAAEMAADEPKH